MTEITLGTVLIAKHDRIFRVRNFSQVGWHQGDRVVLAGIRIGSSPDDLIAMLDTGCGWEELPLSKLKVNFSVAGNRH